MKEDKVILVYFIFTLIFIGGVLHRKKTHHAKSINAPIAQKIDNSNTNRNLNKYSYQTPPATAKAPAQAMGQRRVSSLPQRTSQIYRRIHQNPFPQGKQKLSTQTRAPLIAKGYSQTPRAYVSPSLNSSQYDEGQDLSQKLDSLDYQERKEVDFLKMKVGLNDSEILALDNKRNDYLTQLQQIDAQAKLQSKEAIAIKKSQIIKAHLQWMADYLGPENYYEYLNLTSE